MVLSTFSLIKWGVSCLINWFFRASPFLVPGDYDTSRRSIAFAWLTVVFCPLQASMTTCFIPPSSKLRFSRAFPYVDFATLACPFYPSPCTFLSKAQPTYPGFHSRKDTGDDEPLLLFLFRLYSMEFFVFNKGFYFYWLAKTTHFKCSQNKSMLHEPNKSF